jgi:hypothetical protein
VIEGGVDAFSDGFDASGQADKRRYSAATCPRQPSLERSLAGGALDAEHVAQCFFEQPGSVQARVGLGDPGQLLLLAFGEGVGVGSFQRA